MSERRPTSRGERKRRLIRTAAYRSFRDFGYHETSVDTICKAAGISKGSFYWHYDSKQEVFVDILETWTREVMDEVIQQFEAALETADPARALARAFHREIQRGRIIIPLWLEFTVLARREPEIQRALARFYRRARAAIAEMLRPQVRGSLSEDEIQGVAATIFAAYAGWVMQELADPTWVDAVKVADQFMAVFDRAIYGRERPRERPAAVTPAAAPTDGQRADPREVKGLLAGVERPVRERLEELRALVLSEVPDADERVITGWKVVGYDRGGLFCSLKPTREGAVQLAFYQGADLPDPDALLEGTGKKRRHVTVRANGAMEREDALRELIRRSAGA